jgi:hypothetical protein
VSSCKAKRRSMGRTTRHARSARTKAYCYHTVGFIGSKATSDELLVMVHIGAAAFDGVDRHGRINPDGSEMRGDSVQNKQVELIHVRPLVSLTR